mgnify:CR=1 FL=1
MLYSAVSLAKSLVTGRQAYQSWSEHRAEGSLLLRDFTSRSRLWFVVCYEISSIRRLRGILVNFIYLSHPKGRDKLNKLKKFSLFSAYQGV